MRLGVQLSGSRLPFAGFVSSRLAGGAAGATAAGGEARAPVTRLLARAEAAAAGTPQVDRQKVADIKLAMSRGEFRVDARAVAQAFLAMETGA